MRRRKPGGMKRRRVYSKNFGAGSRGLESQRATGDLESEAR